MAFYFETSSCQNSDLYLNVVYFSTMQKIRHLKQFKYSYFQAQVSNVSCSITFLKVKTLNSVVNFFSYTATRKSMVDFLPLKVFIA
jgi:hypothetical protein